MIELGGARSVWEGRTSRRSRPASAPAGETWNASRMSPARSTDCAPPTLERADTPAPDRGADPRLDLRSTFSLRRRGSCCWSAKSSPPPPSFGAVSKTALSRSNLSTESSIAPPGTVWGNHFRPPSPHFPTIDPVVPTPGDSRKGGSLTADLARLVSGIDQTVHSGHDDCNMRQHDLVQLKVHTARRQ